MEEVLVWGVTFGAIGWYIWACIKSATRGDSSRGDWGEGGGS